MQMGAAATLSNPPPCPTHHMAQHRASMASRSVRDPNDARQNQWSVISRKQKMCVLWIYFERPAGVGVGGGAGRGPPGSPIRRQTILLAPDHPTTPGVPPKRPKTAFSNIFQKWCPAMRTRHGQHLLFSLRLCVRLPPQFLMACENSCMRRFCHVGTTRVTRT